jgi:hypothetical protein
VSGYPQLVAEWHPTKNGLLSPDEISYGSQIRVWWKCGHGPDHEWQAVVGSRTSGTGCPFCAGRKPSLTNCLATIRPDLAAEWHPTRNRPLTPEGIVCCSSRKVWWKCTAGRDHEWFAKLSNRASNGAGCPFCAGTKRSVTNNLAALAPAIAAGWHPTRNGRLRPHALVAYSTRRVWWKCPAGSDHEWRETPNARVSHQRGCPFCAGKRVSITNSLAQLAPEIARQWHPRKNGRLTPAKVTAGSQRRCWWQCPTRREHQWIASVLNRTRKRSGCPHCWLER